MRPNATFRAALFACAMAAAAVPARAQQILLEPVRAGDLTLFRDLTNEKVYYYVSDKPRLATGPDGKPEFSMLRWVENKRSGPAEAEEREGDGGGIVHALVTLGIAPEQIQQAQSELQRQRPGAIIRGPVMYKQGTFGLVSSFKDPAGGLVKDQVVGLGKAPLLDGEKAAVSFQLTKRGAQVLWESLQTPTPDISFTFEMQMAGFRPPARALLEADFDQIYSHKAFGAGIATAHLGAEIEVAFDDLRRTGAIKLTQIGDDAQLNNLISTAYAKVAQIMFDTAPDILKPSAGLMDGQLGVGDSMLSKASQLLKDQRAAAKETKPEAKPDPPGTARTDPKPADAKPPDTSKLKAAEGRLAAAQQAESKASAAVKTATDEQAQGQKNLEESQKQADALKAEAAKDGATEDTKKKAQDAANAAAEHKGNLELLAKAVKTAQDDLGAKKKVVADAQKEVEAQQAALKTAGTATATPTPRPATTTGTESKKDEGPSWAAMASFKMKEMRQRGRMTWDLNKYTESEITLRFDGNIGDVRQYKDHFREVNLWSPLYQQRELAVYVDGANAGDFGQYVNFVTVRLHKKHAAGAITDDEVIIDRNNFNKEGNRFKLMYGWKGDNDRRHWMDYEYQTVWSLFGGKTVETPMQRATAPAIAVTPPYERRTVELRADSEALAKAEVRSVNVKLFYDLAGTPQVKQATLDAVKPESRLIEFMSLPNALDYEYEITWRLKGNRTLTSGRQKSSDTLLDVTDVPQG
jgi:hypothetical protein